MKEEDIIKLLFGILITIAFIIIFLTYRFHTKKPTSWLTEEIKAIEDNKELSEDEKEIIIGYYKSMEKVKD